MTAVLQPIIQEFDRIEISGTRILLPRPSPIPSVTSVSREELFGEAMAAWLAVGDSRPLSFRLFGPPGTGKNTLVYELARSLGRPLYILNGHGDRGPEDVACKPKFDKSFQGVEYVASPIFAAAYYGGIGFFDEMAKVPEDALNVLIPLLDDRRQMISVEAGISFRAHPEFRFCAALNEHEEQGQRLPEYITQRVPVAIRVPPPPRAVLLEILRAHLSQAEDTWFAAFEAEAKGELAPRVAVDALSYAYRMWRLEAAPSLTRQRARAYIRSAFAKVTDAPAGGESS